MASDGPLQPEFQSLIDKLLSLPQMQGAYVYSGYRNNAHQAKLFENALKKYGSVDAARNNVAPEGHSNHNHGIAADLGFANNSQRYWLKKAQKSGELAKLGLQLRMSHEGWHVEPYQAKGDHADFFGTGNDPVFKDSSLPLERIKKWGDHRAVGPPGQITLPEVNVSAPKDNYEAWIAKYANMYGVPPELLMRMMAKESSGKPNATSNKGAMGLLQLMPDTAKEVGVTDPYDPEQNIMGGAKYLSKLYKDFGNWKYATAAYNAGPTGINRAGDPSNWPSETQNYVNRIKPEDFDNPGYKTPVGLMSRLGVTPALPPGLAGNAGAISQQPAWQAPPVATAPAAPANVPMGQRPMPAAPKTPSNMTPEEFEEYKRRYREMMQMQHAYDMAQPPQGFGDNSHVKAGLVGAALPDTYQDMSQGGMNSMNQLQSLMAMILRGI